MDPWNSQQTKRNIGNTTENEGAIHFQLDYVDMNKVWKYACFFDEVRTGHV